LPVLEPRLDHDVGATAESTQRLGKRGLAVPVDFDDRLTGLTKGCDVCAFMFEAALTQDFKDGVVRKTSANQSVSNQALERAQMATGEKIGQIGREK
jgi:hypothetical protein